MLLKHGNGRLSPPADAAALEQLLRQALKSSRARWPGVEVPASLFMRHLAERLPETGPGSPLESLIQKLSLEELYLACACVHGIPGAAEAFERHYLAKLPKLLRSLRQPPDVMDDVLQVARVKLLVRTPDGDPRLHAYTGHGALLSWARVTTTRIALKLCDTETPIPEGDAAAAVEALPAPGVDAELDLIRERYGAEFRQAVREAFDTLSSHERYLLRLYFFERLSTTELGGVFLVNQSTISRWLKSARKTIYKETQRRLRERLDLSTRGFQSFLAVLGSQLDLSISQLFGEK